MKKCWLSFAVILGILLSCSSSREYTSEPSSAEEPPGTYSEYYTSAFPQRDVTNLLKEVQQSVVRIVATGFYDSYSFEGDYITLDDVKANNPKQIAQGHYSTEESTAGTSIILDQSERGFLLITCEHVVAFPDTVISYYEGDNIPNETYIQSISIKKRQSNYVYTGSEIKPFEILASDRRSDLALLNAQFEQDSNLDPYPLAIESGDSNFLQLGSLLYILGFPKGYAMVTRGLASSSESWNDRFFVTDASFNPGISGGLVLASNDNFNSFKWVGMASSSNATREDVLVPRPNEQYAKATRPYVDSVFVQRKTRINYGITQAIPINQIKDFLQEYKRDINRRGFFLSSSRFSN